MSRFRLTGNLVLTVGNLVLNFASLPTILNGGGITIIHGILVVSTLAAFGVVFAHEGRKYPAASVLMGATMWGIMLTQASLDGRWGV